MLTCSEEVLSFTVAHQDVSQLMLFFHFMYNILLTSTVTELKPVVNLGLVLSVDHFVDGITPALPAPHGRFADMLVTCLLSTSIYGFHLDQWRTFFFKERKREKFTKFLFSKVSEIIISSRKD
ncbi:hypothetical protein LSH36_26g08040 [Paralvinella palmiformis]|uniref:Uncharacterized protein n=1 Tax=Paralvinella palmiformis TaxID=53620 RepID=A0AAD9KAB5_9ANNE|nr:hypothetical protein LSH36_26g08040 [Paralvinella palmiformis]